MKPGKTKKLSSLWRGPYTVLNKTSPVNYCIQRIGGTASVTVHRNRLKLCYGDPNRVAPKSTKSTPQPCSAPTTTTPNKAPSTTRSYRDALLNTPLPSAGHTSITTPNNILPPLLPPLPAALPLQIPSRPVRNRRPPERYGLHSTRINLVELGRGAV